MLDIKLSDFDLLSDEEFAALEHRIENFPYGKFRICAARPQPSMTISTSANSAVS